MGLGPMRSSAVVVKEEAFALCGISFKDYILEDRV